MAVAYMVAAKDPLATVAPGRGDHGEYTRILPVVRKPCDLFRHSSGRKRKKTRIVVFYNNVYRIIRESEVPVNRRVMFTRYLYKIKPKRIFKARFVVQDYQRPGMDYCGNAFAPFCRIGSQRILLALAFGYDWEVLQLDVNTHFH